MQAGDSRCLAQTGKRSPMLCTPLEARSGIAVVQLCCAIYSHWDQTTESWASRPSTASPRWLPPVLSVVFVARIAEATKSFNGLTLDLLTLP